MKKFVITGATSDTGKLIAATLKSNGQAVIEVSRKKGISVDDPEALNVAFSNAFGAYIMIPFDMAAPDLHKREREMIKSLVTAIANNNVHRVVLLSGANAYLKMGSSLGTAIMEEELDTLNIPELVHLRCGFFMENFIKGFAFSQQARTGVFRSAFRGDIATPMIATKDIAAIAAEILLAEKFNQPRIRELLGPRDYSMIEATQILGNAIGLPGVKYEQCSYQEARSGMISAGVSESFADAVMETAADFNKGTRWATETRSASNYTPTTLEEFAYEAKVNGGLF